MYPKVSLQDRLDSLEKLKNACFNVVSTAAPFVAAGSFSSQRKRINDWSLWREWNRASPPWSRSKRQAAHLLRSGTWWLCGCNSQNNVGYVESDLLGKQICCSELNWNTCILHHTSPYCRLFIEYRINDINDKTCYLSFQELGSLS